MLPAHIKAQEESKLKDLFVSKASPRFVEIHNMFQDEVYLGVELVIISFALLPNLAQITLKEFNNCRNPETSESPFALQVFGMPNLAVTAIETSRAMRSIVYISRAAVRLENITVHQCYLVPEGGSIPPMLNLKSLVFTSCNVDIKEKAQSCN
ncbi:hypothetical protein PT974_10897 [Cladobotryum mycophilum]|uniref:Uncharacterized protein n=1 Tax=Cladobotryum mycophilum TaxID=491253 RepID=A0ABR0SB39_9HYPO